MVVLHAIFYISGSIPAYDQIWIIGDDFVANTFTQYAHNAAKQNKQYLLENHDVKDFAVKSFCSHVRSPLARLKLQFTKVINEQILLPKIRIFVLEDDVIRHLKADVNTGSNIFNEVIPWLFREIHKLIDIRKDQLPKKAFKDMYPVIYWMELPQHANFSNNLIRRKRNSVLRNETT